MKALSFISFVALATITPGAAGSSSIKYYDLPEYSALVHPGEQLVSLLVDVDCAGVPGVRRLPDGWTAAVVAHGESYAVTILPPKGTNGFKDKLPQISLQFRGQWSDCFSMRIEATVIVQEVRKTRVLAPEDFLPPPWTADVDRRDNGDVECRVPGTALQWAADFCLASTRSASLSDPDAAKCFRFQPAVMHRYECDAKHNYMLKMCEMAVADGSYRGTEWQCGGDKEFVGPNVKAALPSATTGTTR